MFDDYLLPISQHRFDQYFDSEGWCYEPIRFRQLMEAVQKADLSQHKPTSVGSYMEMVSGKGGKSVAIVHLVGTLMKQQSSMGGTSTVQVRRDLRSAANNPNVTGILLAVDSPGGTVAGTYELANEVYSINRHKKPIIAQIQDMGASAAYWIASQANEIYANAPTAMLGSIGTKAILYDTSAQAEKQGIKPVVIATGSLKAAGDPGVPITSEQIAHFQAIANKSQAAFDSAIKRGRGMTDSQLAKVSHGGIFLATEAIELGLIDGIQPINKTLSLLS